jgi:hypothetical protein
MAVTGLRSLCGVPGATFSRPKFTANVGWLVLAVAAFNLTRAAATVTGPALAKATTAAIRRKLIAVPARVRPRRGRRVGHFAISGGEERVEAPGVEQGLLHRWRT